MKKTLLTCLAAMALLLTGTLHANALEKDGQGVYQIATVDDLLDFADVVNLGEPAANAVLTADLDLSAEKAYVPIGNVGHPYTGTFDGQGHSLKDLNIDSSVIGIEEYIGVFGVLGGGANIKNLFLVGENAFVGGNRFVAGIAGGTNGEGTVTIENCGNEAFVYATSENAAGILGVDMLSKADIVILNCYNTGKIEGARECGAISGWVGDRGIVKGCWNTGEVIGRDEGRPFCRFNGCEFENNWDVQGIQEKIGHITGADLAGMATGEFCFRVLNQTLSENVNWYQAIGTDAHPFPVASHGTVYVVGDQYCDGTSKGGETTYSNNPSGNRDPHNFVDGACTRCDEWDPSYKTPDADGFVELASSADLYWYARLVNQKGKNTVSARLTADIVYDKQARLGDSFDYSATFDGQGHKVTFNFSGDADKLAFIKNMRDASIQNLLLAGEINSATHFSAGVVSEAYGTSTIKNVVSAVNINSTFDGDGTHGGLVAVSHDDLVIENSAYVGTLSAPASFGTGGITGWAAEGQRIKIVNCYVGGTLELLEGNNNIVIGRNNPYIENAWVSNVNEKYNKNDYTNFFVPATLSTGEFCYQNLNSTNTVNPVWFQTLGTDAYPVPFAAHGIVYVAGAQNCDGTPKTSGEPGSYSNNPSGNRDPHTFVDGFCTKCGEADPAYMTAAADGYYEISTSRQLQWFAKYTKSAATKNANARLVADINYTAQEKIGADRLGYAGTFDGQEHTVTVAFNGEDRQALFDIVENATIKNFTVAGKIESTGKHSAGVAVEAYGNTTIKNVVVTAEINNTYAGDGTHGGILAIGHNKTVIDNCAFIGTLNAETSEGSGGIMGYTHDGNNTEIRNSYVAGSVYLLEGSNNNVICRNNPYIDNCYASWDVAIYEYNDVAVSLFETNKELVSGELAYRLGKEWRQNLPGDAYPVPFASHNKVYAHGNIDCSGKVVGNLTYDNVEGEPTRQNHNFVDGVCTVCGNAFQFSAAQQVLDFAADVQAGNHTDAYVELISDIDFAGQTFLAIGGRTDEGGNPFHGTFDGKGHKITNMVIANELNNQGFFGVVSGGAVIKNLIIDKTCSVTASGFSAGLVGATTGSGKIRIENCGNEANVTVANANAAGLLGVDDLGAMDVTMINCYNTGAITGQRESAAFAGWLSKRSTITNSWNAGAVNGLDGANTFARSDNGAAVYTNCYETIGTQVTPVTDEQVANGELCVLLNNGAGMDIWFQTVGEDEHPVLDKTHTNAISTAAVATAGVESIYSVGGAKLQTLQKGINIVRMNNGEVKKVLVK